MSTRDTIIRTVRRMTRGLSGKMRGMIRRSTLGALGEGTNGQTIQAKTTADDVDDEVELFEQHGFTSIPPSGSEGVVLRVGGERGSSVAILFGSKTHRFQDLEQGEVAVYHGDGHVIIMRTNGDIDIIPGGSSFVRLGDSGDNPNHQRVARMTDPVGPSEAMTAWASVVEGAINTLAPGTFTPLNGFATTVDGIEGAFATIINAGEKATCV